MSNPDDMRRISLCSVLACLILGSAAPAQAAVAVTAPGGFVAGFVPPVVVIAEGDFASKKLAKKSPWCSGFDRGKCPLFWSPTITTGESTEVQGLGGVKSGQQYAFFCSLHPGMKGTLIVR